MKDLFGEIIAEQKPTPVKGYAARPGSGPPGETCKTCRHRVIIEYSNRYQKCGLVRWLWTGGPRTDIRVKSPACEKWQKGMK